MRTLGGSGFDTAKALVQRPDQSLLLVGHSNNVGSSIDDLPAGNDVSLYYTLPNGSLIESAKLTGSGLDEGNDLVITTKGKVIVVGSTESSSEDFSNPKGGKDIFVAFWH